MSENTPPPPRILLVEDDRDIRETTADLLEFSHFTVLTADGGVRARAVLETQPVDIVVSDIVMPEGDGYNLLRYIRGSEALGHLPVILVSAKADKNDLRQGFELGADEYLTKPYNSGELVRLIRELLSRGRTPPGGAVRDTGDKSPQ